MFTLGSWNAIRLVFTFLSFLHHPASDCSVQPGISSKTVRLYWNNHGKVKVVDAFTSLCLNTRTFNCLLIWLWPSLSFNIFIPIVFRLMARSASMLTSSWSWVRDINELVLCNYEFLVYAVCFDFSASGSILRYKVSSSKKDNRLLKWTKKQVPTTLPLMLILVTFQLHHWKVCSSQRNV